MILVAAYLSVKLVVQLWLQVPIAGSLVLFIAGAVVYAFSVASLGILLATYTTSMGQFGLLVIPILVHPASPLRLATPVETMPVWLQSNAGLFPTPHYVHFASHSLPRRRPQYRVARSSSPWRSSAPSTSPSRACGSARHWSCWDEAQPLRLDARRSGRRLYGQLSAFHPLLQLVGGTDRRLFREMGRKENGHPVIAR